jgi:hypothetical protein
MLLNTVGKLVDYQLGKKDSAPGASLFDYVLKFKIMNLTVANDKCERWTASLKMIGVFCTEKQFPANQLRLRFDMMAAQDTSTSAEDTAEPLAPCVPGMVQVVR